MLVVDKLFKHPCKACFKLNHFELPVVQKIIDHQSGVVLRAVTKHIEKPLGADLLQEILRPEDFMNLCVVNLRDKLERNISDVPCLFLACQLDSVADVRFNSFQRIMDAL